MPFEDTLQISWGMKLPYKFPMKAKNYKSKNSEPGSPFVGHITGILAARPFKATILPIKKSACYALLTKLLWLFISLFIIYSIFFKQKTIFSLVVQGLCWRRNPASSVERDFFSIEKSHDCPGHERCPVSYGQWQSWLMSGTLHSGV